MSAQTTSEPETATAAATTVPPAGAAGAATAVPPSTYADEFALASELRIAVARIMRGLRSTHSLPLTQAAVLGRLDREGAQCIGELATAERVRPQSMSQTLGELEAENLIERSPDETDGRRTKIALTEAGRNAINAERARRDGWLAETLATFTPEERRILEQAVPLLERLVSH